MAKHPFQSEYPVSDYATIHAHAETGALNRLKDWRPAADDMQKDDPDCWMRIELPDPEGKPIPGAVLCLRRSVNPDQTYTYHASALEPTGRQQLGLLNDEQYRNIAEATREAVVKFGEERGLETNIHSANGLSRGEIRVSPTDIVGLMEFAREEATIKLSNVCLQQPCGNHSWNIPVASPQDADATARLTAIATGQRGEEVDALDARRGQFAARSVTRPTDTYVEDSDARRDEAGKSATLG